MVDIFDQACELLAPWTKEIYLCTVAPPQHLLSDLLPHPPFSKKKIYSIYRQLWGVGGRGVELYCRPYSSGVLHSVSDQIQNLQNWFTTPKKNDQ
jgi:hypothetical protein